MTLTITKDYFFKNFNKENNMYVGDNIDFSKVRNFDFLGHKTLLKEINEKCENSKLKIDRMKKVASTCFNILIENKKDITNVQSLKDLFNNFKFFIATSNKLKNKAILQNISTYECPCTKPRLYELDWFNVRDTDNIFYVGSECYNKFEVGRNFNHTLKLREQLVQVAIDGLLKKLNTTKATLLHFCRFVYPKIYDNLNNSNTLTQPQLDKLNKEISLKWELFFKLPTESNEKVGQFVRDHKNAFKKYRCCIEEPKYQEIFDSGLKKKRPSDSQLKALGINGKNILRSIN